MNKKTNSIINVGIAGLGRSGWNIHASMLESLSDKYRIVAVLDSDKVRLKEASDKFGCRIYTEYKDFLKSPEIELVVVSVPSHLHADYSIEALKAGKDVVCEKPMVTKLVDADSMIEMAKTTRRILTIFQSCRYSQDFLKIKEVIQSGKLGRIVMIKMAWHGFRRRWDWQTLKEFGGGELNNNASHLMDQALQLFGEADPKIFCHLERVLTSGDAEDHVKVILQAPNSPMIDLEITSVCAYPQNTWLVMGTQGGLSGNCETLHWKYFDSQYLPPRPVDKNPTPDRSYNTEQIPWKGEEVWELSKDNGKGKIGFYIDLYNTLLKNAPLAITAESVRRQIAILEKCHELCPV